MFVVNIDRPDDEAEGEAEESGEDDCPCDWRHDWDWVSPRCSPASYWAVCPPPIIAPWRLSCSLFQQMWRLRVESGEWSLVTAGSTPPTARAPYHSTTPHLPVDEKHVPAEPRQGFPSHLEVLWEVWLCRKILKSSKYCPVLLASSQQTNISLL